MFDPDYGEYKVPGGAFAKWMPLFVNTFYDTGDGDTTNLELFENAG